MIKGKVYTYFQKYFAEYLFGFDKSKLEVAILSGMNSPFRAVGQVDLKDVNFRPDKINVIFETLRLPFVLKAGMIGKLRLQYNFLSFMSNPFEVNLEDLQLILGPSMCSVSNDDSFIHGEDAEAPYDQSNCYNIFTHNIKLSRKVPGEESHQESKEQPVNENCLFNILSNMTLTITKLHIRYEDDYFSHVTPFAFGLLCDSLTSYRVGSEWQFGSIENSRFTRVAPKYHIISITDIVRDPEDLIIRETNLKNTRVYWKSMAEMLVPLSLYESTKNLERQIFEAIPLEDLRNMMKQYECRVQCCRSFADDNLIEEFSLFSSIVYNARATAVEEAKAGKRPKVKADILMTKFYLNMRPNIVENICTFRDYAQNLSIMHELKNYRPKRRPITSSDEIQASLATIGPAALKRKRHLIVRDWLFFAVWASRIKNLIRNGAKAQGDKETKLREFQRLYSRLIPKQHRPIHDSLRGGRPLRTEESFRGNSLSGRDVDDYLSYIENKINGGDEGCRMCKMKLMKTLSDVKIAVRFQELTVGLYSSNSTARIINGQKKPLIELQAFVRIVYNAQNPACEFGFEQERIRFCFLIQELQLYHFLKNVQEPAERIFTLDNSRDTQRVPQQAHLIIPHKHSILAKEESKLRGTGPSGTARPMLMQGRLQNPAPKTTNMSVETASVRSSDTTISPLKSLLKTFKSSTGDNFTRRCLLLLKGRSFGLKVTGTDTLKDDKVLSLSDFWQRNSVELRAEMGELTAELYMLSVEDLYDVMVDYRELYWFRGSGNLRESTEATQKAGENELPKSPAENDVERHDEDINDVEGEIHKIDVHEGAKSKKSVTNSKGAPFANLTPCGSWLGYWDELSYNTSVQAKVVIEGMSVAIYDSSKNSRICTIHPKPYSSATLPGTTLLITKERESMSLSAFGFSFSTSKPIAFTTFFADVIITPSSFHFQKTRLILETLGVNDFIREYHEFYRIRREKISEKRKCKFNKEEAIRLMQSTNEMRLGSSLHHHQSVLQSFSKYPRVSKARPTAKCPEINPSEALDKLRPQKAKASAEKIPEEDSVVESQSSRGHKPLPMDIVEDDSNPSIPRTNGEMVTNLKAQRMNQYFLGEGLNITLGKEELRGGQGLGCQRPGVRSTTDTPHEDSSKPRPKPKLCPSSQHIGRDSPVDPEPVDELSENINQVFRFPAFARGKNLSAVKGCVPANAVHKS